MDGLMIIANYHDGKDADGPPALYPRSLDILT